MDSEELHEAYGSVNHIRGTLVATTFDGTPLTVKRTPVEQVREFHEAFGVNVGDEPKLLSERRFALRKKLIAEEFTEFIEAMESGDLVHAFKELADLQYVVAGTAVEMGGDFDAVFEEVHRSNMSKLDADGKPLFRHDGKVLKSDEYFEPDIEAVLFDK